MAESLTGVEDEFSGITSNPALWKSDGRMYPPQTDSRRTVPGRASLQRYRTVRRNTYFEENGAIRVETLEAKVLLDKAGLDGKKAFESDGL
ncbi:MAG TPA: hypothetical protein VGR78_09405 [Verrucomicrobiae bacterium]|jgi:hypothetical protein|nr:hypothetical protein [Verrucomicrobiae bacterium]